MRIRNRRIAALFCAFFCLWAERSKGESILEKVIDVRIQNVSQKEALEIISQKGNFIWSYSSNLVSASKTVSLIANRLPIRQVLFHILGPGYEFKQSGNYLILKKGKNSEQRLSGYISDPKTGKRLANATVYDRQTLRSVQTDSSGYYELRVGKNAQIGVSKLEYRDTAFQVSSQTPRFINIDLAATAPPPKKFNAFQKEAVLLSGKLERAFIGAGQKLGSINVRDTLHRHLQLSFVPMVGTNHVLSGNVVNDLSLNLLIGYSRGNRVLEAAGIGNITRQNASGIQAAGLFNELAGNTTGAQFAGLYNHTADTLRGFQAAGAFNVTRHSDRSIGQLSGILNVAISGSMAIQGAGILNHAKKITGIQAAGILNIATGKFHGIQAAGILNYARRPQGALQIAGILNAARDGHVEIQVSGAVNKADTVYGIQAAGILNRAKQVKGIQFGLINIAREIQGLQIGLLNFSKRGGYVVSDMSANEVTYVNYALKGGTRPLYTILTAGVRPVRGQDFLWTYGAGLGTRIGVRKFAVTLDAVYRHLNTGEEFDAFMQEWIQGALAFDLRIGRRMTFAFGPTANLLVAKPDNADLAAHRIFPGNHPSIRALNDDPNLTGWLGWTAAWRVGF
jgi:CarboxypepD_reg-like domain